MLRKILPFVLLIVLSVFHVNAQWSKGKGKGYYKLSAWSLVSDQHYSDTGEIDPNATRGYFNLNLYAEHGITDKLDIIAYFPFFSRTYQNEQISGTTGAVLQEGESLNGIGDADFSLRYGLFNTGKLALSASLKLGLPLGNNSGGSDGSFQTGDGEFNQMVHLDLGIPFTLYSIPGFTKTYFGYNNRTEDFSDELHLGAEAGLNVFKNKIWLIGRLNVVESLRNGSLSAQTNQGSIFANNIEYVSVGGEIAYYFTSKLGVSVAYGGALRGRIIYANPTYTGGVFLDIK
jgi:hypothetical protein